MDDNGTMIPVLTWKDSVKLKVTASDPYTLMDIVNFTISHLSASDLKNAMVELLPKKQKDDETKTTTAMVPPLVVTPEYTNMWFDTFKFIQSLSAKYHPEFKIVMVEHILQPVLIWKCIKSNHIYQARIVSAQQIHIQEVTTVVNTVLSFDTLREHIERSL